MVRAWHLASRPVAAPTLENFVLKDIAQPALEPGTVRIRNLWLSVDPYMRPRMNDVKSYVPPFAIGEPLDGPALGEIVESRAEGFAPGELVRHMLGWRDEAIAPAAAITRLRTLSVETPPQAFMSYLGGTGATAYFGLTDIGQPKSGETIFISAAAGAVGSIAVQLAKAQGLYVIGSAGGAEKCAWVRGLGADATIDYKSPGALIDKVQRAAPKGVDIYFDNVGGEHLDAALAHANDHARFVICGMIDSYNNPAPATLHYISRVIFRRITMRGFLLTEYLHRMDEFFAAMAPLIASEKIKAHETVFNGLEAMPAAFLALFSGGNRGKMLVKL
ncbi:MAG: NADP-dependent oxidoreductase [Hyphomonadaceae bacterium]